jgi:hypothetical protein
MRKRVIGISFLCVVLLLAAWLPTSAQARPNAEATMSAQAAATDTQAANPIYGKMNARWWQWTFSVPASKYPGLAAGGAVDCSVNQSGQVWFLAASPLSSSPVIGSFTRSCTVPVGTTLVVPLINS